MRGGESRWISAITQIWELCILHYLLGIYSARENSEGSEKSCSKEMCLFNLVFVTQTVECFLSTEHSTEQVLCERFLETAPGSSSQIMPSFGLPSLRWWKTFTIPSALAREASTTAMLPKSSLEHFGPILLFPLFWALPSSLLEQRPIGTLLFLSISPLSLCRRRMMSFCLPTLCLINPTRLWMND